MSNPCIICVAITGSLPRKANNPAVPITDRRAGREHAGGLRGRRRASRTATSATTTRRRPPTPSVRAAAGGAAQALPGPDRPVLHRRPLGRRARARRHAVARARTWRASRVGSNNFPTRVYENPPDLVDWLASEMLKYGVKPEIEAFDLCHIHQAAAMASGRPAEGAALRAVRHGREERHAGRQADLRLLRRDGEAARARRAVVRRRHRPEPDRAQRVVDRGGRPHPHRARGQPAPRPRPTRAVERRAGAPRGRALREVRAAGRDPGRRPARSSASRPA